MIANSTITTHNINAILLANSESEGRSDAREHHMMMTVYKDQMVIVCHGNTVVAVILLDEIVFHGFLGVPIDCRKILLDDMLMLSFAFQCGWQPNQASITSTIFCVVES